MLVQQVKRPITNLPTCPVMSAETLLNAHEPELLRRGEIVESTILVLDDNLVILDVGAKRDAIVPPQELAEVDDHFLDELELVMSFRFMLRTHLSIIRNCWSRWKKDKENRTGNVLRNASMTNL